MAHRHPSVDADHVALCTDQYELTMAQAYVAERMDDEAVFSLFVRRLPPGRNYLVATGLDATLALLEGFRFTSEDLDYLGSLGTFSDSFLDYLGGFRFEGDVHAAPEGTPLFAEEPFVEVVAPLPQAQIIESLVMNQIHSQTILASKAARLATAARGRPVVDFGMRRTHGIEGAAKAARAYHVGGLAATSNLLAGKHYGIPVTGTMAHSYIQAHDDEYEAFRAFVREFPETILLVDTYDTLEGVRRVVELARELGDDFRIRGVRLDSGDLDELAVETRRILDDAGLDDRQIIASGGLDEHEIAELLANGAPIDGFGVGTSLGVSEDAPSLDMAYKLTQYAGEGRLKLSTGKRTLPGRKQVFRQDGRDVVARAGETLEGRPVLRKVMERGKPIEGAREDADAARARAEREIAELPGRVRGIADAEPPYPIELSDELRAFYEEVRARVSGRA